MPRSGFRNRGVLEASWANIEFWCKLSRRNKLLGIRRIEPCCYIILAKDDMVDVAGICHEQLAAAVVAQIITSGTLP